MEKTPLQHVISVICDAVCELPIADQARALESARIALGLNVKVVPIETTVTTRREERGALPMVQVEMESGRPLVVNGSNGGRASVVLTGPRRAALRALAAPTPPPIPASGYVRSATRWAR